MTTPPLPADVKGRVLEAVRREPAATRRSVLARSALLLVAAVAIAVAVFVVRGGVRPGSSPTDAIQRPTRPTTLIVATAVGAAALAGAAAWMAVGRGRSMVGRPRWWLLAVVAATPLALLAWKVLVSSRHPEMMACWEERPGFKCLRLSLAIAAAPLLALLLVRRRSDPVHPVATGAALGATAGAFAWVLVDMWCPVAYVPHLLLGHVLPLLAMTAAGALLGWWALRVRENGDGGRLRVKRT